MKFLCLAYGRNDEWQALPRAEQDALLAQDERLRQRGDLVAAVDTTSTVVRAWDGRPLTSEGPLASAQLPLAGFGLLEAENLAHAVALVADTPCARAGGAVELRVITASNDDQRKAW